MLTDQRVGEAATPTATTGTPHPLWTLTAHAVRAFLRIPISLFFTLVFPLAFLVIVSAIVGNQPTDAGVPVAQFLVAPFAVFGVAQAAFCVLAIDTATLRESGILVRLRGAPVPPWTVLASRVAAAVLVSGLAVAILTAVGTGLYGVQVIWRKTPALLVTLLVGIACFAALGLALVSFTRTVLATQTLAQGILVPLAFISDVFIVNANLPGWLDVTGSVLPLKHFARALAETFDPHGGYGFSAGHLAALAAWGVAGAVLARWRFGWSPRGSLTPSAQPVGLTADTVGQRLAPPRNAGRPSPAALLGAQVAYALTGLRRDLLAVFFAVLFPVLLLVLFPTAFGGGEIRGLPLSQYLLPAMMTYAVSLCGYVNLPEGVAQARAQGVLKRLRGSPLPFGWYVIGRIVSVVLVATLAVVLLGAVAVSTLGVTIDAGRLPAIGFAVLLGVLCFSALGLAVAALLPSARSLTAVTLGSLLPLCFVSEVFVAGEQPLPGWLAAIGDVFPLKHLLQALLTATNPAGAGAGLAWDHLAIVAAWTALGVVLAHRAFGPARS